MTRDAEERISSKYEALSRLLIEKEITVATMESCTAGLIASLLTDTEGASAVVKGAFVTYSNEAKIMCGVPEKVIEEHGVYSQETAEAMAMACRGSYRTDIGVGVTGSFGNVDPENEDSVPGQVYFAVATADGVKSRNIEVPPKPSRRGYKYYVANQVAEEIEAACEEVSERTASQQAAITAKVAAPENKLADARSQQHSPSLASRMANLGTESAFAILARANEMEAAGRSVIHCEIGQPDFKTPAHIIQAAHEAMQQGYTGYSPTPGYPQLREQIAAYYTEQKGIPVRRDEVVVVPGGKPVMFFTMLMLVQPGDEVIIPDPGFPIYQSCVRFAGGRPVSLTLRAEKQFRVDPEDLRTAITPRTKLVILNSPSNPTGGVCSRGDLEEIAAVLRERPDIYILSDEIYDRLVFGMDIAPSIAAIPGFRDRTIILNGFSKTYSMTGWRLGYGIMREDLAKEMELLMVNSNSCAASFTQMAGLMALRGPQDSVLEMKAAFQERRDWLIDALNEIPGILCQKPLGAFYAFPDISSFGRSSHEFCTRLLEEDGVATAWGTSFGDAGEGYMRISYATSLDNLKEAVRRLEAFVKKPL